MKISQTYCNKFIIATFNDRFCDRFMTGFAYDKDEGSEINIDIISFSAILIVSHFAS
jgi:hypothetical protein